MLLKKNSKEPINPDNMRKGVFPFIKHLNSGDDSAYSRFMGNANFLIASPRALVKIVDGIDTLEMNDRDTMGDVYEYILGKMAVNIVYYPAVKGFIYFRFGYRAESKRYFVQKR